MTSVALALSLWTVWKGAAVAAETQGLRKRLARWAVMVTR